MSTRVYTLISLLIFSWMSATAIADESELKTLEQKFSYTLGYTFGQQMLGQVVTVDKAAIVSAIDDALANKEPRLTKDEMTQTLTDVKAKIVKMNQEQAQRNLEAGKKFLEENKKKKGVMVLPTGVQYLELVKGEGASPNSDSDVTVDYVGTHINGSVFDSSKRHGGPATFNLAHVIPGFRDAISKMKKGAKWQVVLPADQAYGESGSPPVISQNEALVFEIELLSFENKKPVQEEAPKSEAPKAEAPKK
ncbi:MAG: FKBP-type peptidyl-prolyl cis-trans isomerase [Gammaproteobacteria bacterium]